MKYLAPLTIALALATASNPAAAEVKSVDDNGFSVVHIADVDATPTAIWSRLLSPKDYWNKSHSWSGSVDGFYLDPKAGGCFCENMLTKDAKGKNKVSGTVEHMRVIFADPGKVLRMQGALGPLQSEAVLGTLTVAIVPAKSGSGSTVSFSYVVGGYMRYKVPEIAAAVDKVIGQQFTSMVMPFNKITVVIPEPVDAEGGEAGTGKQGEWSLDLDALAKDEVTPVDAVKAAPKTSTKTSTKPKAKSATASKTGTKPATKTTAKTPAKPVTKPAVKPKPKVITPPRKDPEVR
jgi:hypothetical protein